jgi:hypothetical protein
MGGRDVTTPQPSPAVEPPALPPPPFAPALRPAPRPTVVTVVAICGICWASITLLGALFGSVALFLPTGIPNPVLDAMRTNRGLFTYSIISTLLGAAEAALLLAASIAALPLRPWARKGLIVWAVAKMVLSVVGQTINWFWVQPIVEAVERQQKMPEGMLIMARVFALVGVAILGVALPLVVIYLMTRRDVKSAFAGTTSASV